MRTRVHITCLYLVCGLSPRVYRGGPAARGGLSSERSSRQRRVCGAARLRHMQGAVWLTRAWAGKRARADALRVRAAGARACSFARSGQGRGARESTW